MTSQVNFQVRLNNFIIKNFTKNKLKILISIWQHISKAKNSTSSNAKGAISFLHQFHTGNNGEKPERTT